MKTILFVESEDAVRKEIVDMLVMANYHILTANNGKEGFATAKRYLPDIIISAMVMPMIDGLGMLYMLRHDPLTEAIPFIFLSSRIDRSDFRNAMDSGADDFITKPFSNDELFKAIENRLKRIDAVKKNVAAHLQRLNECGSIDTTTDVQLANLDMQVYQQKQPVFPVRYSNNSLYVICNEKVKTFKTYEDGKQLIMSLYYNDTFLGYIALLAESTYKKMTRTIDSEMVAAFFQKMS